jgi:GxxExxY protein
MQDDGAAAGPSAALTHQIIGAAMQVHRELGPGLLESAYEVCLAHELTRQQIPFARQVELPIEYDQVRLDCGYRMDLLVADSVIVELKAVEMLLPIHEAQLFTYLRLSRKRVALMINFNVEVLKHGLMRRVL